MKISGFKNFIKQAGYYIPITLYFFLFIIATVAAWKILHQSLLESQTSFADILALLLKVAAVFALILVSLALISVIASLVYFLYKRKKGLIEFKISTDLQETDIHHKQMVRLLIHPILKPFMGFIKIRLQYDEKHFSGKFSLLENRQRQFFNKTINGTYYWPLPAIKEYHVQKAIVYFEDVFQFFSLAVNLPVSNHFYTQPGILNNQNLIALPRKTEDTSTRIDEMRRVNGEYLNYKNFENNDDVRRIVWKIYAKNKELVVRVPEIMDPYASHVYLYASFFTHFNIMGNTPAEIPFLNYFKMLTWTVYNNLAKQGLEVRYVPDQDVPTLNTGTPQQIIKYSISTSKWQTNMPLKTYCKTSHASIVIISSLSNAEEVKELVDSHGNDITFIFVRLTESLNKHTMMDWVQWLFVQNEKNDIEVYKSAWLASFTLRPKIIENEKTLQQIISLNKQVALV